MGVLSAYADRAVHVYAALVSQQGSLHRVADENAIDRLVEQVFTGQLDSKALEKRRQFKGNLKQLCGFKQHGHNSKSLVNGYQMFDRMRWICMDGAKELVPILGTPEEAFKTVLNRTDVNFSLDDLKQLLPSKSGNQKKKQVGNHPYIWRLASQPPIAAFQNIPDGGRLTDFYVSAEVILAVNPAAAVIPAAERARQARAHSSVKLLHVRRHRAIATDRLHFSFAGCSQWHRSCRDLFRAEQSGECRSLPPPDRLL